MKDDKVSERGLHEWNTLKEQMSTHGRSEGLEMATSIAGDIQRQFHRRKIVSKGLFNPEESGPWARSINDRNCLGQYRSSTSPYGKDSEG
jgi:hypothetical protein